MRRLVLLLSTCILRTCCNVTLETILVSLLGDGFAHGPFFFSLSLSLSLAVM